MLFNDVFMALFLTLSSVPMHKIESNTWKNLYKIKGTIKLKGNQECVTILQARCQQKMPFTGISVL